MFGLFCQTIGLAVLAAIGAFFAGFIVAALILGIGRIFGGK